MTILTKYNRNIRFAKEIYFAESTKLLDLNTVVKFIFNEDESWLL